MSKYFMLEDNLHEHKHHLYWFYKVLINRFSFHFFRSLSKIGMTMQRCHIALVLILLFFWYTQPDMHQLIQQKVRGTLMRRRSDCSFCYNGTRVFRIELYIYLQSMPRVPNISLTMYLFSIWVDEHVSQNFLWQKGCVK